MAFPTCWDGVRLTSSDQSHVSYDTDGGTFDGDCPESHPVKLPEVQFFFRIVPYRYVQTCTGYVCSKHVKEF